MKLTLYYAPVSCALVSWLALTEAGAQFAVEVVDFKRRAHLDEAYLRLNPKHQVPVLVIDGEPLTENMAILLWIARRFPAAQLLPAGVEEFRAIELMAWCDSGIHPSLTPNALPERYCDLPDSADSVRHCAQRQLHEKFRIAEDRLAGREWFFERFTLADIFFFWCFRRAGQFKMNLSEFTQCQAHFERVAGRASTRALLAFEAQTLARLQGDA